MGKIVGLKVEGCLDVIDGEYDGASVVVVTVLGITKLKVTYPLPD